MRFMLIDVSTELMEYVEVYVMLGVSYEGSGGMSMGPPTRNHADIY